MNKIEKDKEWLEEYTASSKREVEKLAKTYEVKMEFWGNLLQEFNSDEKVKVFNDGDGKLLIESISRKVLNNHSNFSQVIIAYRANESDLKEGFLEEYFSRGFYLKLEKENDNVEGYFLRIDGPFYIKKEMVENYYECEKQYFNECKLALENIEKSIVRVLPHLEKIEQYYEDMSNIFEENGANTFISTITMMEDFLRRHE